MIGETEDIQDEFERDNGLTMRKENPRNFNASEGDFQ